MLGAKKGLFSYFSDFIVIYFEIFDYRITTNKNPAISEQVEYIGKYLYLNRDVIKYNTSMKAKEVIRSTFLDKRIHRVYKFNYKSYSSNNNIDDYLNLAVNLLTFRYTGWETEEFTNGTTYQRDFIKNILLESSKYLSNIK